MRKLIWHVTAVYEQKRDRMKYYYQAGGRCGGKCFIGSSKVDKETGRFFKSDTLEEFCKKHSI